MTLSDKKKSIAMAVGQMDKAVTWLDMNVRLGEFPMTFLMAMCDALGAVDDELKGKLSAYFRMMRFALEQIREEAAKDNVESAKALVESLDALIPKLEELC
jgi:hypothetical protein